MRRKQNVCRPGELDVALKEADTRLRAEDGIIYHGRRLPVNAPRAVAAASLIWKVALARPCVVAREVGAMLQAYKKTMGEPGAHRPKRRTSS